MKTLSRNALIKKINAKFPKMPLRMGEAFNGYNELSIWTGEDAGAASDGNSIFYAHSYDVDPKETTWVMGVHRELLEILDKAGWYAEFHDAGTVFLFKN